MVEPDDSGFGFAVDVEGWIWRSDTLRVVDQFTLDLEESSGLERLHGGSWLGGLHWLRSLQLERGRLRLGGSRLGLLSRLGWSV